jgi:hypothetical protein
MVLGIPLTATAATVSYSYGESAQNAYRYSGYKVWTASKGFAVELPLYMVMEAKAGAVTAQGTGGVNLYIAPSNRVNRYIGCRWISAGGWAQPTMYIECLGDY